VLDQSPRQAAMAMVVGSFDIIHDFCDLRFIQRVNPRKEPGDMLGRAHKGARDNSAVVALEPDPENYEVARQNLQSYGKRCHLLKQAIWPSQTRLLLKRSDRHDATQVSEESDGEDHCASIDPLTILTMFNQERISLFKCDIEGAEEKLFFEDSDRWLEKTDNLAIEIHGEKAHQIVYGAMRRHPFESDFDHDLHYFKRTISSNRHTAR